MSTQQAISTRSLTVAANNVGSVPAAKNPDLRLRLTEPGRQLERALAVAERIAAQAPLGVQATLRSARLGMVEGEPQAAAHVLDDMPGILASDDFREGVASFRERRAAGFLGK